MTFAKPVTVTARIPIGQVGGADDGSVPALVMWIMSANGRIEPMADQEVVVRPDEGTVTMTATTTHFSTMYVGTIASLVYAPPAVVSSVGQPAWTFNVSMRAIGDRAFRVTDIVYISQKPTVLLPDAVRHPDAAVPPGGALALTTPAPKFECGQAGKGFYRVGLRFDPQFQDGTKVGFTLEGMAECTAPPATGTSAPRTATAVAARENRAPQLSKMQAAFDRPVTTYAVTAEDPDGDPLTYEWSLSERCGTFKASGRVAQWSHPHDDPNGDCPGDTIHAGVIHVVVSDGQWKCHAWYYKGSAPGESSGVSNCVRAR